MHKIKKLLVEAKALEDMVNLFERSGPPDPTSAPSVSTFYAMVRILKGVANGKRVKAEEEGIDEKHTSINLVH